MKILIADDDAINRHLLSAYLIKWRYEVVSASDGEEAWRYIQQEDSPQLMILDWMMPGMDGTDICRKVREAFPARSIYIILLTTRDSREDVIVGLKAGANDYVTKPFNKDELQARVQVGVRVLDLQDNVAAKARELEAERQQRFHLQELMLERERFEAAVSAMSDGIVVTDPVGRISYANHAACLLLNIPPQEYQDLVLDDVLTPFTLSVPLAQLRLSEERETALEISRPHTRPPLYLEARLTRLVDKGGSLAGQVLAMRDITIERQDYHVRASFFTMVSHKLRTPLTVLSGYLKVCSQLTPAEMGDHAPYMLKVCLTQASQLENLVGKLLDLKRLSAQEADKEVQQTDIRAVLEAAMEEVKGRYPSRNEQLTVKIAPGAACTGASADHLRIVLETLLDNAVKFGDKDPVLINVHVEPASSSQLRFTVSDNGPGIPHEYYDRIFKGFVQVEEFVTGQVPGLGVGLYMAREVVTAYGGDISIQSYLGKGATLSFTLPAAGEA